MINQESHQKSGNFGLIGPRADKLPSLRSGNYNQPSGRLIPNCPPPNAITSTNCLCMITKMHLSKRPRKPAKQQLKNVFLLCNRNENIIKKSDEVHISESMTKGANSFPKR